MLARTFHQKITPPPLQSPVTSTEGLEAKKAIRDARKHVKKYWSGGSSGLLATDKMKDWNEQGPPSLPEYRLTFGKNRGIKLDEVNLTYVVKYLIPICPTDMCPIVGDAIDDYVKKHPETKSQAGPAKVQPVELGKNGK